MSAVTPLSSVTIVVFTDGEDNYSHKTSKDVKEVLDKSISSGLKISYVGSNQDAIFTGSEMGIPRESCLAYVDDNFGTAMRSVSDVVNRCITGEAKSIKFDDEVRKTVSDSGNQAAPFQFERSLTTSPEEPIQVRKCILEPPSSQFDYYGDTVEIPKEPTQVRYNSDDDFEMISRCLTTNPGSFVVPRSIAK